MAKTGTTTPFIFEGERLIEEIRTLIRYDIPVLMLGKSSIGKSFTMIAIANKFKMPHQILYVGSEKSEHIEGLPKLVNTKIDAPTLEYLKPYWFPNSEHISLMVKNGRDIFDRFKNYYQYNDELQNFSYQYSVLARLLELLGGLKWGAQEIRMEKELVGIPKKEGMPKNEILYAKAFVFERDKIEDFQNAKNPVDENKLQKDELRDICVYLCTLLGYGNFWLMLDEIDKVEENDTDKFAPLLHIVRERWLKKWKLREINGGEGVDVARDVRTSDYSKIKIMIDDNIALNKSLLDTRVIAIANKTQNLEPALFRRFCQVIMTDLLLLDPIDPIKGKVYFCIKEKFKSAPMDLVGLEPQKISEINLQWSLGFFNRMLNLNDLEGNFIVNDFRKVILEKVIIGLKIDRTKDPDLYQEQVMKYGVETILYKILTDNFLDDSNAARDFIDNLFSCLSAQIDVSTQSKDKTLAERVQDDFSYMAKEKYSEQQTLDAILYTTMEDAYEGIKSDKLEEIKKWVDLGIAYLKFTLIDGKGKFLQMPISKMLIPQMQRFIYQKLVSDTTIDKDVVKANIQNIGQFWIDMQKITPLANIQVNKDELQKVLYGRTIAEIKKEKNDDENIKKSSESIYGAGKFLKDGEDGEKAYKKSLSYRLAEKEIEDTIGVLKVYSTKYAQLNNQNIISILQKDKNFDSVLKFIKEPSNLKKVKNEIAKLKASGLPPSMEMAKEIEKLIS